MVMSWPVSFLPLHSFQQACGGLYTEAQPSLATCCCLTNVSVAFLPTWHCAALLLPWQLLMLEQIIQVMQCTASESPARLTRYRLLGSVLRVWFSSLVGVEHTFPAISGDLMCHRLCVTNRTVKSTVLMFQKSWSAVTAVSALRKLWRQGQELQEAKGQGLEHPRLTGHHNLNNDNSSTPNYTEPEPRNVRISRDSGTYFHIAQSIKCRPFIC